MDLANLTVDEIAGMLHNKEVSCKEIIQAYLDRIKDKESSDDKLNAFLFINEEGALQEAEEIDSLRARGEELPPLAGIPVAVKDNICVKGLQATCGSKILYNYVPPYDATAISKLKAQRAIIIGKTNLDEFAMGSSTENSYFGPTKNPYAMERTPGGSSGGSAVAVASDCCPLALGSETGGSVRQPASFCGVVGVKPTYGRVSRYGLVAFASSFDQIGTFGKNVKDAARMLGVISGVDRMDSTSRPVPVANYLGELEKDIKQIKIGIPDEYFPPDLDPNVERICREAAERLEKMGAEIIEISLPQTKYAIATYYIITPAEASANLARYDGVRYGFRTKDPKELRDMYSETRSEGFGAEVQRRILIGTYVLSAGYYDDYYLKAQKVRTLFRKDFQTAFEKVDVILTPTAPTPAFKLGEKIDDPVAMYLSDIFTCSANLAGVPAISVPAGKVDGLPVGVQLMANQFDETTMLRVANALERSYV